MKQFTIKELAKFVSVSEGTVRSWIMKPIDGVPYSSENINYENLVAKLNKYFPNFESEFGFDASEIEIVKAQRTYKKWIEVEELEENRIYTIHNYSLKTQLKFVRHIEDLNVFLFATLNDEVSYKAYTQDQLEVENIKIEEVEA